MATALAGAGDREPIREAGEERGGPARVSADTGEGLWRWQGTTHSRGSPAEGERRRKGAEKATESRSRAWMNASIGLSPGRYRFNGRHS